VRHVPDRPTRERAPGPAASEAEDPAATPGSWGRPASGRGPGVLVLAGGSSEALVREACARLARNGFVAFAPALPGPEAPETGDEGPGAREREGVDAALHALWCEHATEGSRVGVLGIGRGGLLALDAAARAPRVAVAASLDGDRAAATAPLELARIEAVVLALFAEKDAAQEPGDVQALARRLRDEGVAGEVRALPGVGEGYLDPDRPDRYDAVAARASWDAALARLRAEL